MDKSFVPSSPPENGVYLSGLVLRNACWDASKQCVGQLCTGNGRLPITWLKPVDEMAKPSSNDEFNNDGI